MAEESRKRSRFDQEPEPERPRKSRFDRRDRSPPPATRRRSRSPVSSPSTVGKADKDKTPEVAESAGDAAARVAAAAAKIRENLKAKLNNADLSATRSTGPIAKVAPKTTPGETYHQDGDYQRDIEINHLRNRYTLTKGAFQKMIKEKTGADVTTKGVYVPDSAMATPANPPLYLHITSQTKEGLEGAAEIINDEMKKDLPDLVDERRFKRVPREENPIERDSRGRPKWPDARVPIPLEPIHGFNLRAQVVGQQGAYVKYIQQQTTCRVQIKGRGSGFLEEETGAESDEQMYLHISGRTPDVVERAKELALELLANVKVEYDKHKARGPSNRGRNDGGGHQHYGNAPPPPPGAGGGYQGYGHQAYGGAQSPPPPPPGNAMSPTPVPDYSQYAAYYQQPAPGAEDPYAAYGGQEAYFQYYAAYMQAMQQAGSPAQPVEAVAAPPPPPGGEPQPMQAGYGVPAYNSPPPLPPGASAPPPPPPGSGGYNAVPPPPGM